VVCSLRGDNERAKVKYQVFLENVPSVNHIHGRSWLKINCPRCKIHVKTVPGYTFTTTEGKQFLEYAALLLKTAIPLRDFEGKLVVEAFAHWPDRRARDMSNYAKFIADALQLGGIVKNDKTVLWRDIDYKLDPGVQGFDLTIYPKDEG
jgi:Holliday junction resolvase RusA-like endonuclease